MGEQVAIVWKGTAPISARGRESSCRALLLLRCCCLLAVVVDLRFQTSGEHQVSANTPDFSMDCFDLS
jgi:hypothetical protein